MARLEIIPFSDEQLDAAADLLAGRHRRQRLVEPRLPERFEEPRVARVELEELWQQAGASGAVAYRGHRALGYLLGTSRPDSIWGPNVWVELAGHAAEEAEVVRDLYGASAGRWLEEGRHRHYAVVPAHDRPLVDAWFNVGFGLQHVHALRELDDEPRRAHPDVQVGVAEARDVDDLVALAPLLGRHQALAPVFGSTPAEEDPEQIRAELLEELEQKDAVNLVAEIGDRIVGNFFICPLEQSSMHTGPGRPERASFLGFAITHPDVRGSGAGLALTDAAFRWALEQGYDLMVTDWRATNLLSSRFWPKRGFRPMFLRLYRSIP